MSIAKEAAAPVAPPLEDVEIALLLEGVYRHYGYDFRDYALPSLRRRIRQAMLDEGARTISALQERVLHDPRCLQRLVLTLSVNVTALFRDPPFYKALRERVPAAHRAQFDELLGEARLTNRLRDREGMAVGEPGPHDVVPPRAALR